MRLDIRSYRDADESTLIALWRSAGLTRPWNDPKLDIDRKRAVQRELLLVAELEAVVVGSAMAGYDGHRGAVYYVAVSPEHRRLGIGRRLMGEVEQRLTALGCPKLNLMVRDDNEAARGFYGRLGYLRDSVVVLGKRLIEDPASSDG